MRIAGRGLGVVLALLVIIAAAIGSLAVVWQDYRSPGPLAHDEIVVLPRGDNLLGLSRHLHERGIIAHPYQFIAGLFLDGKEHKLKAGEYRFAAGISPAGVARLLASGKVVEHRLTIPEGLTSAEIVKLVNAAPALTGHIAAVPPDGSLLPETYFFIHGDTRASLIRRMRRAMAKTVAAAWAKRAPNLPYAKPEDAVTLASIIEKETAKPTERAHIAGIYLNRLKRGMKLQADPTVLYAMTDHGKKPLAHTLTHADLATPSPYNTYLHQGLPPGPIANPGRASLEAALHPEATDDLYFVSDGNGAHHFARTLKEQNHNVATLRREDAARAAEEAAKTVDDKWH